MIQFSFAALSAFLIIFFGVSVVFAKPPSVRSIFPSGAMQGAELELKVADIPEIWPSSVWVDHSGILFKPNKNKKGVYNVSVDLNTPVGPHLVRFYNNDGSSKPCIFFIGLAEEIVEKEPNDKLNASQYVKSTPTVVNGRLGKNGDVDAFTVRVNSGEWIVAQCFSYSLDSPVDSFIHLHNEEGVKLAFAPDTQNIDPLLAYQVKETGDYTVTLAGLIFPFNATARFHGSEHTVYRLTISTGSFARNTYPLGVKRGFETPVHIEGWGFGDKVGARAAVVNIDNLSSVAWLGDSNLAAPVPVVVGDLSGKTETEPNNTPNAALNYNWPSAIHGRIDYDDDDDRFKVSVRKGDNLLIGLRASEFNSSLDPVLKIEDQNGNLLGRDDDSGYKQDAKLNWKAPADGEYLISVSDLIRTGSDSHFYRLEIDHPRPSLTAIHSPDRLIVEAGTSSEFTVTISLLGGFSGEPFIIVQGLPDGVSAQIPGTEKGGKVTLKIVASETANAANVPLKIQVMGPDENLICRSNASIGMDKAGGERLINFVDHLWLTVKPKQSDPEKTPK